ncbi:MAG: arylsulfatase [Pirellulaceae bacterium]|nr:arylsulfatase [Pirellulaceae bacterium]
MKTGHPQISIARFATWAVVTSLVMIQTTLEAETTPPHVVVLLADDLGWGDVGYHGSQIATPNIDKLAQVGVRLEQFYVQPVCSPTRGALLTGRYPMRLGLQCGVVRPWAEHGLPQDERTLPAALKENGYQTAIVGKWHLGHNKPGFLPLQRGFDQQYGHYNGALDYFTHIRDDGHDWHKNDQRNDDQGYTTELIGREATRIIKEHDKEKPLFLYVPFNAPHTPLQAPQGFIDRYADWPNKQRAIYAAMVTCMDQAIGDVVGALEENDFPSDNTLIFFCSDNGGIPRFGSNRELRSGKGSLYEGGVRVPAIIVWKGQLESSRTVDQPLHMVDLYPTILNLAGVSLRQPKAMDGRDAWPTIAEGATSPHEFILHNVTPFGGALRMGDWKLIRNGHVAANHRSKPKRQTWELFNIADDPSEKNDVKKDHPDVFDKLKAKLVKLADDSVPPNIPPNRPPPGFRVPKVWGESGSNEGGSQF